MREQIGKLFAQAIGPQQSAGAEGEPCCVRRRPHSWLSETVLAAAAADVLSSF